MSEHAHTTTWLIDLLKRTPVLMVDVERAQAAGDVEAVRYARAIAVWLDEARIAVAEASGVASEVEGAWRVGSDRLGERVPHGDLRPELVSSIPCGLSVSSACELGDSPGYLFASDSRHRTHLLWKCFPF